MAEHRAMDMLAEFFRELSEEVAKAGVLHKQLATILGLSPASVSDMFKSGRGGNKTPPSWERVERILLFCWEKRDHGKFPGMTESAAARGLADVQSREMDGWKVRHAMLVRDMERARKGAAAGNSRARTLFPAQAPPEARYSLPPDTAAFTGRASEVAQITAAVTDAAAAGGVVTVGAIDGMPGAGKTALAVHAAHLLRDQFPDRQLFIDLRAHTPGQEPVQPEDALAVLLTAAGVDPRFLPADLDSRAGMWRSMMAGQRALLVLDNAASSRQITPLLPGSEGCLVLVTSRRHLGDLPGTVVPLPLDTLPPQQAREMFTALALRAASFPAEVAHVVRLAGFLPLAISLLARVYARHPSWTLANLADEIQAGLLTLTAEHDNIAAAFEVSYRYLDPAQQRLFCLLGLHPGTTTDVYAASALAAASLEEAARLLDELQGQGLLTETRHRRYGMHDLLRRYACEHAAVGSAADSQQALDRLLDYYQHAAAVTKPLLTRQIQPATPRAPAWPPALPALESASQALAWARAERASLLTCLDHATRTGQHTRTVALTGALAGLLRRDGPWGDAITRHSAAIQTARDLGDLRGQAGALTDLADVQRLTGDYPAAARALGQALTTYHDLSDRTGQANALTGLGEVRRLTGDYPAAAQALEQALSIYRDLGNRTGQANALTELGTVRRMTADYPGSVQVLEQALNLYSDAGNRIGQARAIHRLVDVQRLRGDYPEAAQALEQVLSIYRDLGDRVGQANALTGLGDVRSLTADYGGATQVLEQALDISRDLSYQIGQANALLYLGTVRRLTGDYAQASQDLEQALNIYRDLGDLASEAETLNEEGTLHRVSDDPVLAAGCHQRALELACAITSSWDKAHALFGLGRCALATGHSMRAEALLQQAYEIFQQIGAADARTVLTELNTITLPQPTR